MLELCPCGNELERWIDDAIGICTHCRSEAHKKARKPPRCKPTITDVPLPGLEEWGA